MTRLDYVKNYLKNSIEESDLKDAWNEFCPDQEIFDMDADNFNGYCEDNCLKPYDALDMSDVSTTDYYFWTNDSGDLESFDSICDVLDLDDDEFAEWFLDNKADDYFSDDDDIIDAFINEYNEWADNVSNPVEKSVVRGWVNTLDKILIAYDWDEDLFMEFDGYFSSSLKDELISLRAKVAELTEQLNNAKADPASANEIIAKFKALATPPTEENKPTE